MAFPMMPGAQFDIVRKMGPDELNKAAMAPGYFSYLCSNENKRRGGPNCCV